MMSAPTRSGPTPADLVAECLSGGVRRLIGAAHSLTSSRAVVVCADEQWVRVRFSSAPGSLPAPWEVEPTGWVRAPRASEPGLRDASADPVLVVVGVAESQVVAINALAVDEIGVTCAAREAVIANWVLQAQVQGAPGDGVSVAGAVLSDNPDATVVVADPMTGESGWVDVLAAGTAWPVRPLTAPIADVEPACPGGAGLPEVAAPPVVEAPPPATELAVAGEAPVASGARMRVFGRFEVLDDQGAALQPMQQDMVGGIYFHQPVSTHDLCGLLFGTARRPGSFHVALSKMRKRGLNPVLVDGGYRINIACDWQTFTDLVGPDPAAADTAALASAAAMITGPLFGEHPPAWATPLVASMRRHAAGVRRELAARHVDQPAAAVGYARQGLAVDTDNPELLEIIDTLTANPGVVPRQHDEGTR